MPGKFNSGLPRTNPASGQGGTWPQGLKIIRLVLQLLGHTASVIHHMDGAVGGAYRYGWCSRENTRLPPMWLRCKSQHRHHMWVLSLLREVFSGYSGFPFSLKTNTFKFQFDLERTDAFQKVLMTSLVLRG